MVGGDMQVSEITAATPGNQDFGGGFGALLQDQDLTASGCGLGGAHQARGPASQHDDIMCVHADKITGGGFKEKLK